MKTVTWYVPDFHCANCLARIKQVLATIDGVHLVQGQPNRHLITVEAGGPEGVAYAKRRLAEAGYPVQPHLQKQV